MKVIGHLNIGDDAMFVLHITKDQETLLVQLFTLEDVKKCCRMIGVQELYIGESFTAQERADAIVFFNTQ